MSYEAHLRALAGVTTPLAYVDLDALDANAQELLRQAGPLPIRVASKSLRCTALLKHVFALDPRFQGLMGFTVPEMLALDDAGFTDLLVAYPSVDTEAIAEVARRAARAPERELRLMVDHAHQLELISEAATKAGATVPVLIDIDAGLRPLGSERLRIGPKRSPLYSVQQVRAFAELIARTPGVRLAGAMAYDGQVAGVGDLPPGRKARGAAIRQMQRLSLRDLRRRIPKIVAALEGPPRDHRGPLLINVGGTGSLSRIREVRGATELTAGSGFYAPTLFDTYRSLNLRPAAFFVLPVVRKQSPETAPALGGGYLASGPGNPDRVPRPVFPAGLELDPEEGAGEVQTPLLGPGARALRIGDRVIFRHTKAGELCERFSELHLVRGDQLIDVVPTYRGEGFTFL